MVYAVAEGVLVVVEVDVCSISACSRWGCCVGWLSWSGLFGGRGVTQPKDGVPRCSCSWGKGTYAAQRWQWPCLAPQYALHVCISICTAAPACILALPCMSACLCILEYQLSRYPLWWGAVTGGGQRLWSSCTRSHEWGVSAQRGGVGSIPLLFGAGVAHLVPCGLRLALVSYPAC